MSLSATDVFLTFPSRSTLPDPQSPFSIAASPSQRPRISISKVQTISPSIKSSPSLCTLPHPSPATGKIEIANADESLKTQLSVSSGLILQTSHTLLATFDPLKAFSTSAFGPVRLRAIAPDGTPAIGYPWPPSSACPRLPTFTAPAIPMHPCTLTGSDLYLVDSVAPEAGFANPVSVPEGFVGNTLSIPRPPKSGFYLKLRDEPESANLVNMPVQIQRGAPTPQPAAVPPSAPPAANPAPAAAPTDPATAAPSPQAQPQPQTSTLHPITKPLVRIGNIPTA